MAQLIAVIAFLCIAWQGCTQALAASGASAVGKFPLIIGFAWAAAIAILFVLTKIIWLLDDKFNNTIPMVTDMNTMRACDRIYATIRYSHEPWHTDNSLGTILFPCPDIMRVLLFLTPWDLFRDEFGETLKLRVEVASNPKTKGSIVYVNFTSNSNPKGIRGFGILERIATRNKIKNCLNAKDAPELPRQGGIGQFNFEEAEAEFEKGREAYKENDYDIALQHIKKAIEIRADKAWYWQELGNVLCAMQMYQEAREAYKEAIELEPDDGWNHVCVGYTYYTEGNYEKALQLIDKGERLGSRSEWAAGIKQECKRALQETI